MRFVKGPTLPGAWLADVDLANAHLHSPVFEGAKITDGDFWDANISGRIEGLHINGVEIAPLVEAELNRRFPGRATLRATDPQGLAEAWAMIERLWDETVARAHLLPEAMLHEQVDAEWSFVETLRHLILATDIWLGRMVRHESFPYHPWGLAGSWLADPRTLGLDPDATPPCAAVLEVRRARMDTVSETINALTPDELARVCIPPDPPGHPGEPHSVLHCLGVILNEEWEHNQYANRDLGVLEAGGQGRG